MCAYDTYGTDLNPSSRTSEGYPGCFAACDAQAACKGFIFQADSNTDGRGVGACYFKQSPDALTFYANTNNPRNVAAIKVVGGSSSGPGGTASSTSTATSTPTAFVDRTCTQVGNGTVLGNFRVECATDRDGANLYNRNTASFSACVQLCENDQACSGISYVGGNNPGVCYIKGDPIAAPVSNANVDTAVRIRNGTSSASSSSSPSSSSAAASASSPAAAACPYGTDGSFVWNVNGSDYNIRCGADTTGVGVGSPQPMAVSNFDQCFSECERRLNCAAFTYIGATNTNGNQQGQCYFKARSSSTGPNVAFTFSGSGNSQSIAAVKVNQEWVSTATTSTGAAAGSSSSRVASSSSPAAASTTAAGSSGTTVVSSSVGITSRAATSREATPTTTSANRPSTTQTSTGCSTTPSIIAVTFRLNIETVFGELMYVVGSIPQLGTWQPDNGLSLKSDQYSTSNPIWYNTTNIAAGTSISYKYVKRDWLNNGGAVVWENDPNRQLTVTANCAGTQTVSDIWNPPVYPTTRVSNSLHPPYFFLFSQIAYNVLTILLDYYYNNLDSCRTFHSHHSNYSRSLRNPFGLPWS